MYKPFVSLLAATSLLAALAAQERAPAFATPATQAAWSQFLAQYGRFTAEWNPATGTPSGIWGDGIDLRTGRIADLAQARQHATALLASQQVLLGSGATEWREAIGQTVDPLHILVYDQYYKNLKVIGGRADVRVHQTGAVSFFGASAYPLPANLNVLPAVSSEEAILRAYAHLELQGAPIGPLVDKPAVALVLWADAASQRPVAPILAWEVDVVALEQMKAGKVYVAAVGAHVLQFVNGIYTCGFGHDHVVGHPEVCADHAAEPKVTVTHGTPVPGMTDVTGNIKAWLNPTVQPTAALQNLPLAGIRVSITGVGSALTDANGDFTIVNSGTTPVPLTASFTSAQHTPSVAVAQGTLWSFSTTATPGTPVAIQLFTSAAGQFDYAQSNAYFLTHKINEYVRAIIGSLPAAADAIRIRVNLAQTCNAYYSGSQINFYAAGGSCPNTAYSTVVEHEWGHGIDQVYGGISQTEGLSEGWGDVLAIYSTGQPIVGPGFQGNPNVGIRTGLNTKTRGSCTEVHCAGESWMGWTWDVRTGLIAKLGQIPGVAIAEKIVIGTLPANATSQNPAALQVFLLDDNDANLNNGTPNCDVLKAACAKRNITDPTGGCGTAGSYSNYGTACAGSGGTPTLAATGVPTLNKLFTINLLFGKPTTPVALNFGVSKTVWGTVTLPFDLTPYQAPGCSVLASGEIALYTTTSAAGTASTAFTVPNDAALVGVLFYNQWAIIDAAANGLGVTVSAGGQGKVGL